LHLLDEHIIFTSHRVYEKPYPIVRKLFLYIFVSCLASLLSGFTPLPAGNEPATIIDANPACLFSNNADQLYESLDLEQKGLSKQAFELAYKGYTRLLKKKMIQPGFLTICDFSQSSRQKRLYLIDIETNEVLLTTYVAHGRNSGGEYATRFSNRPESRQSSLGFYVTEGTYQGDNGLSLRMQGIEPGFNDKAFRRGIVVHGAQYIGDGSIGRSFGCPAVPKNECGLIINTIKEGTCLFIYHPQKKYLHSSKILND
jgi:hypothetical protein